MEKLYRQQKITNGLLAAIALILLIGLYLWYRCACPAPLSAVVPAQVIETTTPAITKTVSPQSIVRPVVYNNTIIGITFTYPGATGPVTVNTAPCPAAAGTVITGSVGTVKFASTSGPCTDTAVPTPTTTTTSTTTTTINPDGTVHTDVPVDTTKTDTPIKTDSGATGIITKDPKFGTVVTFKTNNADHPTVVFWSGAGVASNELLSLVKTLTIK